MAWRLVPITILALLLLAAPAAATDVNGFVGFDTGGKFDLGMVNVDAKDGYHIGAEVMVDLPILEFGVGFEYGVPRKAETGVGDLDYKLIYAVTRLSILGPVYVTGRYGFANVKVDEIVDREGKNGNAWSLGGGISLVQKLKIEALYSEFSTDFDYKTYSVRLIYTFGT